MSSQTKNRIKVLSLAQGPEEVWVGSQMLRASIRLYVPTGYQLGSAPAHCISGHSCIQQEACLSSSLQSQSQHNIEALLSAMQSLVSSPDMHLCSNWEKLSLLKSLPAWRDGPVQIALQALLFHVGF